MTSRRNSILILIAVFLITVLSVVAISRLKFSYDFEAFFPKNDPATDYYINFRDQFETDNDFFIIALENPGGVFDQSFLLKVDSLTNDLRALPHVTQVMGPTQLSEYYRDPALGQVFKVPMIHLDQPELFAQDSARIWQNPGLPGLFFAPDGKSVAINLKHQQYLSKEKCDVLSDAIKEAVGRYDWSKSHIIGRAMGQKMYITLMAQELALFISLSFVLTVIFLFIAFRSGWGVIIPSLIVFISILWTLGFIYVIGKDLDLMLTVLPTILFVVGISDSVHFLTKYVQVLREGGDRVEAIRKAFKGIRLATFLTSVTTAIGFMTLMLSNIEPIADFGLYTSFGVLLAYGLTYAVLPAVLLLAKPKRLYAFSAGEDFWYKHLHRVFRWLLRKRRWILPSTAIIVALSTYFIYQIKVDNLMLEDLRDTHILKQEFNYMETHFSGCRPFELSIELSSDSQAYSLDFLNDIDTIGYFLRNEYGVGSMLSLAEIFKTANKSLNAGDVAYFRIPETQEEIDQIKKFTRRKDVQSLIAMSYNEDSNLIRISGKVADRGRKHYDTLNVKLKEFIAGHTKTDFKHEITGTAHLIDVNNSYMVDNLLLDLFLSIVVIGLVMSLVYGSWRMFFITIIPNMLPLFIVGGIMGATGIPLKVSTSIIFNIAYGIAVDDTIHFLAQVRSLLRSPIRVITAVKRTFLTTGKAMIVTTLILSGGFLTLVLSDFMGTFYIGFLIGLTLFLALIAELIVTPFVVIFFYKKSSKNRESKSISSSQNEGS